MKTFGKYLWNLVVAITIAAFAVLGAVVVIALSPFGVLQVMIASPKGKMGAYLKLYGIQVYQMVESIFSEAIRVAF